MAKWTVYTAMELPSGDSERNAGRSAASASGLDRGGLSSQPKPVYFFERKLRLPHSVVGGQFYQKAVDKVVPGKY